MDQGTSGLSSAPIVGGEEGARYALLGRLAVGGMAELYLARALGQGTSGPVVVLKRILPHLAEDPEFVRMFRDEAYLAATLDHPNIVRVFDIGRHGEDYFFTMEYVHGENLRNLLRAVQKRGEPAVPLEHVLTITAGLAAGLHYAHERTSDDGRALRIVHRDVSPTNVLVAYDGTVKIVDFGIAKAAAGTHITQAGMLKGKASYMSPEQCRADPVDRRSDVFAIGILLYEMSTMTRLFRGENELAILHQVLTGQISKPSERREGYPADLERIVLRALQPNPNDRYLTALELLEDLERLAQARGIAISTDALGTYLSTLFGWRPLPWAEPPRAEDDRPAAESSSTGLDQQKLRDETAPSRMGEQRTPVPDPPAGAVPFGPPDVTKESSVDVTPQGITGLRSGTGAGTGTFAGRRRAPRSGIMGTVPSPETEPKPPRGVIPPPPLLTQPGKTGLGKMEPGKARPSLAIPPGRGLAAAPLGASPTTPGLPLPARTGHTLPGNPGSASPGRALPGGPAPAISGRTLPGSPAPAISGRTLPGSPAPAVSGRTLPGSPAPAVSGRTLPGSPASASTIGGPGDEPEPDASTTEFHPSTVDRTQFAPSPSLPASAPLPASDRTQFAPSPAAAGDKTQFAPFPSPSQPASQATRDKTQFARAPVAPLPAHVPSAASSRAPSQPAPRAPSVVLPNYDLDESEGAQTQIVPPRPRAASTPVSADGDASRARASRVALKTQFLSPAQPKALLLPGTRREIPQPGARREDQQRGKSGAVVPGVPNHLAHDPSRPVSTPNQDTVFRTPPQPPALDPRRRPRDRTQETPIVRGEFDGDAPTEAFIASPATPGPLAPSHSTPIPLHAFPPSGTPLGANAGSQTWPPYEYTGHRPLPRASGASGVHPRSAWVTILAVSLVAIGVATVLVGSVVMYRRGDLQAAPVPAPEPTDEAGDEA